MARESWAVNASSAKRFREAVELQRRHDRLEKINEDRKALEAESAAARDRAKQEVSGGTGY